MIEQEWGGRRTWGDAVTIKCVLSGELLALAQGLLAEFACITRCAEPARPLLVHLGSGSDAVDGKEEELLRADGGEEVVNVGEDGSEYLFFCKSEVRVGIVWVRTCCMELAEGERRERKHAVVDYAVEVEVEVV
jgi:hypothetical protein